MTDDTPDAPVPPRYTITTVNDFLSLPPDRLADCLSEFAVAIETHHGMRRLIQVVAEAQGTPEEPRVLPDELFRMPYFVWIDDGKRDATVEMIEVIE